MILGLVGLFFSLALFFLPGFGPVIGLAGVVISIIALVQKQSKGMSLTGIITGAVAIIAGVVIWIAIALFANQVADDIMNDPTVLEELEQLEQDLEVD